MGMVKTYAILDSEGKCVNRVLWDGKSEWQPPDGHEVILDPDEKYPIHIENESDSQPEPLDVLKSLTVEQQQALLSILDIG